MSNRELHINLDHRELFLQYLNHDQNQDDLLFHLNRAIRDLNMLTHHSNVESWIWTISFWRMVQNVNQNSDVAAHSHTKAQLLSSLRFPELLSRSSVNYSESYSHCFEMWYYLQWFTDHCTEKLKLYSDGSFWFQLSQLCI